MNIIIEFIVRFRDYITVCALTVISFLMISEGNTSNIGGFKAFVISKVGLFQDYFSFISKTGSLENENKALRELNLKLTTELIKSRKATVENEKLRGIIGFKETFVKDIKPVEVIGTTTIGFMNFLTINAGEKDSLQIGMPVRTDAGLVGVVSIISKNYALIELIKNKDVKVAVKVIRPALQGILEWDGSNNFKLQNIPETYDIKVGDVLVTSNYSNTYPENIPIGTVRSVKQKKNSLFLDINIDTYVDFNTLTHVFIVNEIPDPERVKLVEELIDRIQLFN